MPISERDISALVYKSCLALDEEDFDAYLALCGTDFRYRITARSPELGRGRCQSKLVLGGHR